MSLANAFDLLDDKAPTLKYPPKLEIRLGAGDSVNNPFDGRQFVQDCVPPGKRTQRHQHTFPTTLDLSKFNHQSVRLSLCNDPSSTADPTRKTRGSPIKMSCSTVDLGRFKVSSSVKPSNSTSRRFTRQC